MFSQFIYYIHFYDQGGLEELVGEKVKGFLRGAGELRRADGGGMGEGSFVLRHGQRSFSL